MSQILLALRYKCLRSLPDVVLIGLFTPAQFTTAVQLKCKPTIFFLECHFMKGGGEWLCWLLMMAFAEEVPVGTLIGSIPTKAGFTYRCNFIKLIVWSHEYTPFQFNATLDREWHLIFWRLNQPSPHFTLSPTSGELRTSSRLDREGRDGSDSVDLVALSSSPTYPIEASHLFSYANSCTLYPCERVAGHSFQLASLFYIESFSTCVSKQMEGGLADHVGERWCHGYERAHGSAIR